MEINWNHNEILSNTCSMIVWLLLTKGVIVEEKGKKMELLLFIGNNLAVPHKIQNVIKMGPINSMTEYLFTRSEIGVPSDMHTFISAVVL